MRILPTPIINSKILKVNKSTQAMHLNRILYVTIILDAQELK